MVIRVRGRRVSEKAEQAAVVKLLGSVGGKVYVLGRPPRWDSVHKGTGQTPGIPDLLCHLPDRYGGCRAHQVWVEVKAAGGRLRPEQAGFRDFCEMAGIAHVVGGVEAVVAYLAGKGYVKASPAYGQPALGVAR